MEKRGLRNLAELSSSELKIFLDSFDNVLCDGDGVLYLVQTPIIGAHKSITKFKEIGKRVGVVTNNCTRKLEDLHRYFEELNFNIDANDIIYPTHAIINYLKGLGFEKEIFLLGTTVMREEFVAAGLKVADPGEVTVTEESIGTLIKLLVDNEKVGAVVFDSDFNYTYIKISKAVIYLHRKEVLFIVGASDKFAPIGTPVPLLGPGGLQQFLEEFTRKQRISLGKPGKEFNEFLKVKFNITDPSRTLFIGDSLSHDIQFANLHGYQSLLVLTGISSLEEAKMSSKDLVPDFYINSIGDIYKLIANKLSV